VDAARLLGVIRPLLAASGTRWALAGGFAIAAWGSTRTTHDLDILAEDRVRRDLLARLLETGFRTVFDTEGFSNLDHPTLGPLDFLWVEGETCRRLFAAAVERPGPDGLPLLVPSPEHLVAMKVKAIVNRPIRVLRDGEDLRLLLSLPDIDQNEARAIFDRVGLRGLYDRLKTTT